MHSLEVIIALNREGMCSKLKRKTIGGFRACEHVVAKVKNILRPAKNCLGCKYFEEKKQ